MRNWPKGQQPNWPGRRPASPDLATAGETLPQQRTALRALGSEEEEEEEAGTGFVGSKGERDTSGLIEDEDFKKDGQGSPEGK